LAEGEGEGNFLNQSFLIVYSYICKMFESLINVVSDCSVVQCNDLKFIEGH